MQGAREICFAVRGRCRGVEMSGEVVENKVLR